MSLASRHPDVTLHPGRLLWHNGILYRIVTSGIRKGQGFAEIDPPDVTVANLIAAHIHKHGTLAMQDLGGRTVLRPDEAGAS